MTPRTLLQQLHALGVVLTPYPDSTLCYKAPTGTLTPALLDAIRQHKAALLALLSQPMPAAHRAASPEPLTQDSPCVVCASTDRWEDAGIWRCRRCWPPGSLAPQATPHTFPARST